MNVVYTGRDALMALIGRTSLRPLDASYFFSSYRGSLIRGATTSNSSGIRGYMLVTDSTEAFYIQHLNFVLLFYFYFFIFYFYFYSYIDILYFFLLWFVYFFCIYLFFFSLFTLHILRGTLENIVYLNIL